MKISSRNCTLSSMFIKRAISLKMTLSHVLESSIGNLNKPKNSFTRSKVNLETVNKLISVSMPITSLLQTSKGLRSLCKNYLGIVSSMLISRISGKTQLQGLISCLLLSSEKEWGNNGVIKQILSINNSLKTIGNMKIILSSREPKPEHQNSNTTKHRSSKIKFVKS